MKKAVLFAIAVLFMGHLIKNDLWAEPKPQIPAAFSVTIKKPAYTELEKELVVHQVTDDIAEEEYYDSLEYLACCIQAEAGTQSLEGKKLVCDVILNRVDSPDFPGSIREVIDQSNQFSVVANGAINKVSPSEDTWEAVMAETETRTNTEVIYFRTGKYHEWGSPLFKVGKHYFSGR